MATLSMKITTIVDYFVKAIKASDEKCQALEALVNERDQQIEALNFKVDLLKEDFDNADASLDEILAGLPAETEPTPTPDPVSTPGADAIIEAADSLDTPNTPEVDAAMSGTVGTSEPTSDEAVAAAVEMLTEEVKAEPEVSAESSVSVETPAPTSAVTPADVAEAEVTYFGAAANAEPTPETTTETTPAPEPAPAPESAAPVETDTVEPAIAPEPVEPVEPVVVEPVSEG